VSIDLAEVDPPMLIAAVAVSPIGGWPALPAFTAGVTPVTCGSRTGARR
jgi:hypothetical protein